MAEFANALPIVRNTFWDLVSEDIEEDLPCLRRSHSDHCINYAISGNKKDRSYSDFSDSTTTAAGTSRASSEVGSDDVGSWTELGSGNGSWAEMTSGPPGVFTAAIKTWAPNAWTAPCPTARLAPAKALAPTCSADSQPTPEREDTTVIVRKVPGDLSRAKFLDVLDAEGFEGLYAFVYLPMNFQKGVGLGYAIVNFATSASAAAAALRLSSVELGGKRLQASISDEKQSLSDLILRYRDSAVMHPSVPDDCKPVLFSGGLKVPFPEPTKILDPPVHTKAKRNSRKSAR